MTAVVDAAWHKAPCTRQPWLFHPRDRYGLTTTPHDALALCAVCPVLDACRRLPEPEVQEKWVVQAGTVWKRKQLREERS